MSKEFVYILNIPCFPLFDKLWGFGARILLCWGSGGLCDYFHSYFFPYSSCRVICYAIFCVLCLLSSHHHDGKLFLRNINADPDNGIVFGKDGFGRNILFLLCNLNPGANIMYRNNIGAFHTMLFAALKSFHPESLKILFSDLVLPP